MAVDYRLDKYYDEADSDISAEFTEQLSISERYQDFNKIASGGMKVLYKTFDEKSQRYIAYATLKKDAPTGSKDLIIKEARLTAKLNHPNIIPVYDIGLNEEEVPFFTMELKTGDSLQDIIDKLVAKDSAYCEKYDLRERLNIFIKVCDALDFAHDKKVIHLDIKPDNIQVGNYGEVIVCDWGLSKIYDRQSKTVDLNQLLLNPENLNTDTLNGQIKGSPGFMAPEQINSNDHKTPQTDIFSLGCLLYCLLGLKTPFKGNSLNDVLDATLYGKYEQLKEIPQSLQAVINKAMANLPAERYTSVSLLKTDIENFLSGYATEAEDASLLKVLKLFFIRNKALSVTLLSALMIIVLGTLTFIENIQEEKNRAQENLKLFKAQKTQTSKAQNDYYQALIKSNNIHFHHNYQDETLINHRKTIRGLLNLIASFPEVNEAKSALGYHYFIAQKFELASEILKKTPGIYGYMLPYAEKYRHQKQDSELLNSQDFTQLLNEITPLKVLHLKMLMYYSARNNDPKEVITPVKEILSRINPQWDKKNFYFQVERSRLVISGKSFTKLRLSDSPSSPVSAMKAKILVLRKTGIQDIKPLYKDHLEVLDISETGISFFNLKSNLPSTLKRLIITKQQFTKKQLSQLPDKLEIKIVNSIQ